MNYTTILKHNPNLKLVDINSITTRFQEITNGDVFIIFNTLRNQYELHSVKSFNLSGDSFNAVVEIDQLNGYLIIDYKLHNHRANCDYIESEFMKLERIKETREESRFNTDSMMKIIERTLGTKV